MDNLVGPLTIRIGGEANGEDREDELDVVVLVVVIEVDTVVEVEVEAGAVLDHMIPLPTIAVGCMAIWPVTVPNLCSHREVALLALLAENLLNPCREAQEEEAEEVDRSASVASASCMTTRVTNTPSMMQDSCMCCWKLDRLLSTERMRWKMKKL